MGDFGPVQLNMSVDQQVKIVCVDCAGPTHHRVLASVDRYGSTPDDHIHWEEHHQIVQCQGCEQLSFRIERGNSEDMIQVSEDDWEPYFEETVHPPRVSGWKGLGGDSVYLPYQIRVVYGEVANALNNGTPLLAGLGLRLLIEAFCMDQGVSGNNLKSKIEELARTQVITGNAEVVLQRIRVVGNDAAHEVQAYRGVQLTLGMEIIESLFRDVYVFPRKVDATLRRRGLP